MPLILLTARAGEDTAIEGLLAGAADSLVKPFSARELIARVGGQIVLSRTRREGESAWAAAPTACSITSSRSWA